MLVIACQQEVGLEESVNEFDESQDVIVQGLQLTPEGSILLLACPAFGINGRYLDCCQPTPAGPPDFAAIHSVASNVIPM
jgi:hypothetical protein